MSYLPRNYYLSLLLIFGCFLSCKPKNEEPELVSKVDVFIGTASHGHTFPGAVLPFGMVQLSPDTRTLGWDACSGYHYSDSTILGFSHRHLSGTGMTDFADVLFTPFSGVLPLDSNRLKPYYPLAFSHANEKAGPGYYTVKFNNGILAELTATTRVGYHNYTFPETNGQGLLIDLFHNFHNQKVLDSEIEIINDREIRGMRLTEGWSKRDYVFFHAKFSEPFKAQLYSNNKPIPGTSSKGQNLKLVLSFDAKKVEAKVGISPVDLKGALGNLETEISGKTFVQIRNQAAIAWNKQLSKITVEGGTSEEQKIFYTAMYHAFIHPSTYSDADKRYRGQDMNIHQLEKGTYYTIFSLWDTFRAQMPLVMLLNPELTNEFIQSLLLKYQQGGLLPMWDIAGCYSGTMIGAHATSVIADAYTKGILGYDTQLAYKAMWRSVPYDTTGIMVWHPGILEWLMTKGKLYNEQLGFIPADRDVIFATSRGLEYAYCDWALAQVAKEMGKTDDYNKLLERGMRYKKYYDPKTGFMRALKSDGTFMEPFIPSFSNHMNSPYCEGNAWQWTWFVPQDVNGLIELMGGKKIFEQKLDTLFSTSSKVEGSDASPDISGMIGQYAHGNEPSHHIIFLYNYIGKPEKTQELADKIMREEYSATPGGLTGNEDCGQMSAWYILNAMGFYQVAPGKPTYTIGRPIFDRVSIKLGNDKQLVIKATNNSAKNKYVKSVMLNGKLLEKPFFEHADIVSGGELIFQMTEKR